MSTSSTTDLFQEAFESGNKKNFQNDDNKIKGAEKLKKMFVPFLKKGETQKTFRFRMLPTTEDVKSIEIGHFHNVLVNGKWEKFSCNKKNFDGECELCNVEEALKFTGDAEDVKISKKYRTNEFFILRGIDRDNEGDGVKFWRIKKNFKKQGVGDKINDLIKLYKTHNKDFSLDDVNNGYDLFVNVGLDDKGNSVVTSIMVMQPSKLFTNDNLIEAVLTDKTTWKEIFTPKSNEHLKDVVAGKAKYWDDVQKKYVTPNSVETEAQTSDPNASLESVDLGTATFGGNAPVQEDDLPF